VSVLNINVIGQGKSLFPSSIIIHDDNISTLRVDYQEDTFYGNSLTVNLKPGNYSVYAIGDYYDENIEYILMDYISMESDSVANATLSLDETKLFNVNSKALDGRMLRMYEWEKSLIVYGNGESFSYSDVSEKSGQRDIYISNNPSNINVDVVLNYRGIPYD
jgi:hypothetical protein